MKESSWFIANESMEQPSITYDYAKRIETLFWDQRKNGSCWPARTERESLNPSKREYPKFESASRLTDDLIS
jgi:hypothetical protein